MTYKDGCYNYTLGIRTVHVILPAKFEPAENLRMSDKQSAVGSRETSTGTITQDIDLGAMYSDLWAGRKTIIISVIVCLAIGIAILFKDKSKPPVYSGQAVVKIGQYIAEGGVQTIVDVEELVYRFQNITLIKTRLDQRKPIEGLIRVSVNGGELDVKTIGEKRISEVMQYLGELETQMTEQGIVMISGNEVLVPLSVGIMKEKDRTAFVMTAMLVIGLILGIAIILIKQSVAGRTK